jgi:hypothetical protein
MKAQPYIYRKQIKFTGKYYIGKHNGNNLNYKGSGVEWKEDLKKYVKDSKIDLIEEILEYVDDISKLNEREIYWLNKFDVVNNPLYYNKTNKSYGVCKTEEHTKLKQSLSSPKRKKIIQYGLNGKFIKIWDCMNDVYKQLKIETGDLTRVCQGKQKSAGKYQWKYYTENYPLYIPFITIYSKSDEFKKQQSIKLKGKAKPNGFGKHRYKAIIQLDKNNNKIAEYTSIREACHQFDGDLNKIESNIGGCINGKQKTAYGYIWKSKN